jgi:hypothetical protein
MSVSSFNVGHLGGKATPGGQPGVFYSMRVSSIEGGKAPMVAIRNGEGGEVAHVLLAVQGAQYEAPEPIRCPRGVYVEVTGNPSRADITVRHSIG